MKHVYAAVARWHEEQAASFRSKAFATPYVESHHTYTGATEAHVESAEHFASMAELPDLPSYEVVQVWALYSADYDGVPYGCPTYHPTKPADAPYTCVVRESVLRLSDGTQFVLKQDKPVLFHNEIVERERKRAEVAAQAMAKLTADEVQALGLTDKG